MDWNDILSFVRDAALIAFKAFITALAKLLVNRRKDRTAPTDTRDGSDTS